MFVGGLACAARGELFALLHALLLPRPVVIVSDCAYALHVLDNAIARIAMDEEGTHHDLEECIARAVAMRPVGSVPLNTSEPAGQPTRQVCVDQRAASYQ